MKRVDLDGRVFIVRLNADGTPNAIRERKTVDGRLRDNTYWHRRRSPGGPQSIPSRVLAGAGF